MAEDLRDPDRRDLTESAMAGDQAAIDELLTTLADHYPPDKLPRWGAIFREPDPSSVRRGSS